MMTEKEMQNFIEDEITVDCYDEDDANMSWYYFMSESMEFPFRAKVTIKKRNGSSEESTVEVVSDATNGERFRGESFYVNVDYNDVLMKVEISDVHPIDASENTLKALALWQYNKKRYS